MRRQPSVVLHSETPSPPPVSTYGSESQLIPVPPPPAALGLIDDEILFADVTDGAPTLRRGVRLPTHPHFVSPALQAVPSWLPVRTHHVAAALLAITSFLSFANILFSIYTASRDGLVAQCVTD